MLFKRIIARQRDASFFQGSTFVSVGLHTVAIGALGLHLGAGPSLIHDTIVEGLIFLAPPPTAAAGPSESVERITFSHLSGPELTGDILGSDVGSIDLPMELATAARAGTPDAGQQGAESFELPNIFATRADSIYLSSQVDNPAAFDARSGAPMYPDSLRTAGVEGAVTAQFVVDSTGRVDVGSFVLLSSTHGRFTQSVREALPRMLFRPAELNGQRIKQLVQLPFIFRLEPADSTGQVQKADTLLAADRPAF